ncbi:MAG: N-acetylmuramoyl-L-alanine amidase [Vampirovibrionales bacterium]|nr:N-acetylmuramoyl-L-alanine amidase [Vampirovibrionales bacterium]
MTPQIEWVYPGNNHQTAEASTFLIGRVVGGFPPGSTLLCEQPALNMVQTVECFEPHNGFFAHPIALKTGAHAVSLKLIMANGQPLCALQKRLFIRLAPIEPAASAPEWLWPKGEIKLSLNPFDTAALEASSEGLLIRLAVPTSTSWGVRLKSGQKVYSQATLKPLALPDDAVLWDNRTLVFGRLHQIEPPRRAATIAEAQLFLLPTLNLPTSQQAYELTLEAFNNAHPEHGYAYPHQITIIPQPEEAQVTQTEALTRVAPHDEAARLTPQPQGTWHWLNRQENGYARLAFSKPAQWVRVADLIYSKNPHSIAAQPIRLVEEQTDSRDANSAQILIPMATVGSISWQVEVLTSHTARLEFCLHHTISQCDVIHLDANTPDWLGCLQWQAKPQGVSLQVMVYRPLCGIVSRVTPDGLQLTIRVLPKNLQDFIIGLDAGHGGNETGALAADSTAEKTLNLKLALAARDALGAAGFSVVCSRTTDETLSLSDRLQRLNDAGAHLVLSLHHNALPDGRDPTTERGFGAYYYHPWAANLTRHLVDTLPKRLHLPTHSMLYNSLAITRNPKALSILIETGFLTHPEEATLCLAQDFPKQFACHLTQALTDWIASA